MWKKLSILPGFFQLLIDLGKNKLSNFLSSKRLSLPPAPCSLLPFDCAQGCLQNLLMFESSIY
jgi:hypothetical protein